MLDAGRCARQDSALGSNDGVRLPAEYLAAWGNATYTAMAQADAEAVWVLDGWFANANGEPWFWCGANKTHAQHYLSQGEDSDAALHRVGSRAQLLRALG